MTGPPAVVGTAEGAPAGTAVPAGAGRELAADPPGRDVLAVPHPAASAAAAASGTAARSAARPAGPARPADPARHRKSSVIGVIM
ncbi:MAG TPA: hypothetical protein VKV38_03335 [Trebonia sp.]|nr:hypothetical protein [Trebonia sp.]